MKKGRLLNLRVSEVLLKKIEEYANAKGISKSGLIRMAVIEYINKNK